LVKIPPEHDVNVPLTDSPVLIDPPISASACIPTFEHESEITKDTEVAPSLGATSVEVGVGDELVENSQNVPRLEFISRLVEEPRIAEAEVRDARQLLKIAEKLKVEKKWLQFTKGLAMMAKEIAVSGLEINAAKEQLRSAKYQLKMSRQWRAAQEKLETAQQGTL